VFLYSLCPCLGSVFGFVYVYNWNIGNKCITLLVLYFILCWGSVGMFISSRGWIMLLQDSQQNNKWEIGKEYSENFLLENESWLREVVLVYVWHFVWNLLLQKGGNRIWKYSFHLQIMKDLWLSEKTFYSFNILQKWTKWHLTDYNEYVQKYVTKNKVIMQQFVWL